MTSTLFATSEGKIEFDDSVDFELAEGDMQDLTDAEVSGALAVLDPFQTEPRWDGIERRAHVRVPCTGPVRVERF